MGRATASASRTRLGMGMRAAFLLDILPAPRGEDSYGALVVFESQLRWVPATTGFQAPEDHEQAQKACPASAGSLSPNRALYPRSERTRLYGPSGNPRDSAHCWCRIALRIAWTIEWGGPRYFS